MNLFFDVKYTNDDIDGDIISLGVVDENNRSFYAEFNDYDNKKCDSICSMMILPHLEFINDGKYFCYEDIFKTTKCYGDTNFVKNNFIEWVQGYNELNFMIGEIIEVKWALFSRIFGESFEFPDNINPWPIDIMTLFHFFGVDIINDHHKISGNVSYYKQTSYGKAMIIKKCYNKFKELM